MQYLLMIYFEEAAAGTISEAEIKKTVEEYGAFTKGIVDSKHFLGANRLEPSKTAATVRVRNGKTATTHGPYAEAREQLGGYYLIEAKDIDEASEIAARIPHARHGAIEVRPVFQM